MTNASTNLDISVKVTFGHSCPIRQVTLCSPHDRDVPGHNVGNRERSQDRHHESAGGGKDTELRIRSKEKDQRPDIEHQLEDRIELLLLRGHVRIMM